LPNQLIGNDILLTWTFVIKYLYQLKIPYEIFHLKDYQEAQVQGSPFGTLDIYYK